jgi:hypothetical protein
LLALVSTTLTNLAYLREHDAAWSLPGRRLRQERQGETFWCRRPSDRLMIRSSLDGTALSADAHADIAGGCDGRSTGTAGTG